MKTGDLGKAKRRKSFNFGKLIFFLNLKSLLKNQEIKNMILKAINTKPTALEPPTKNDLVIPNGIIKVSIDILNTAKNALTLKSNINCVLFLIFISNKILIVIKS